MRMVLDTNQNPIAICGIFHLRAPKINNPQNLYRDVIEKFHQS